MRVPARMLRLLERLTDEVDEQLGMYTGLTEPVDFDQNDGAERAARMGRRRARA